MAPILKINTTKYGNVKWFYRGKIAISKTLTMKIGAEEKKTGGG